MNNTETITPKVSKRRKRKVNKAATPKEEEVLKLLAEGLSSKQIAERLGKSFHTVESHRKSLREKFSAHNVMEIITKTYQIVPMPIPLLPMPLQPARI